MLVDITLYLLHIYPQLPRSLTKRRTVERVSLYSLFVTYSPDYVFPGYKTLTLVNIVTFAMEFLWFTLASHLFLNAYSLQNEQYVQDKVATFHYYKTVSSLRRLKCASKCDNDASCERFAFTKNTHTCFFGNNDPTANSLAVSSDTVVYKRQAEKGNNNIVRIKLFCIVIDLVLYFL